MSNPWTKTKPTEAGHYEARTLLGDPFPVFISRESVIGKRVFLVADLPGHIRKPLSSTGGGWVWRRLQTP